MKNFFRLIKSYPLTLLCLALIILLSLVIVMPETELNNVAFIDKWTHLVMYAGMCSVMWFEYLRHHDRLIFWKLFLYTWLGPIVLGGVIELIQPYVHRSGEWLDLLADATGTTLAVGVGLLMNKIKRHHQLKQQH